MSTGQAYLHLEPGARKQCRRPRATQRLPSWARTRKGRIGLVFFVGLWRRPPGFWSPDLSYVAQHRGDVATARDRLGTAIALCEEVGDPITRWLATCRLGEVDALTGDYPSVRACYEQILHKGVVSGGDLARHSAVHDLASHLPALDDMAGAAAVIDPWVTEFEDELPMISIPFLCPQGGTSTIL